MNRLCVAFASLVLSSPLIFSGQARADDFEVIAPRQMADIMQNAGYRAEITEGKDGTFIKTGVGGYNAVVDFYDCKSGKCSSIQFYTVFKKNKKFTTEFTNDWNKKKRYLKAYIDQDEDLILTMDVDLDGGASKNYVREKIRTFEAMLSAFDKF